MNTPALARQIAAASAVVRTRRSEEHTSELQSQSKLVCRLLLEKKQQLMRQEPLIIQLGDIINLPLIIPMFLQLKILWQAFNLIHMVLKYPNKPILIIFLVNKHL